MTRRPSLARAACHILGMSLVSGLLTTAGAARAGEPPRNLFRELLGKTDEETAAHIDSTWRQLREGDTRTQRLFYEAPDDTAYIADTGNDDVRSEGMSYGMMICVQLGCRDDFNKLWRWARLHMRHDNGPRRGYFAWQCAFNGRKLDDNSASDGEEWVAMALLFAGNRWDTAADRTYGDAAQDLLREMRVKPAGDAVTSIFDRERHQVVFVPSGGANGLTDPSYHLPAFYELWARWDRTPDGRTFWDACAKESRGFFRKAAHPETGLMPEYAAFDGSPWRDTRIGTGKGDFRFDAWRTLSNVALDHAWWQADPWQVEQSNRVLRFLTKHDRGPFNAYTLDGEPLSDTPSAGLVAMAAAAGLAADPALARPFVQRLWDAPVPEGKWRYYHGLLHMLGLLQAGGRFQIIGRPVSGASP